MEIFAFHIRIYEPGNDLALMIAVIFAEPAAVEGRAFPVFACLFRNLFAHGKNVIWRVDALLHQIRPPPIDRLGCSSQRSSSVTSAKLRCSRGGGSSSSPLWI